MIHDEALQFNDVGSGGGVGDGMRGGLMRCFFFGGGVKFSSYSRSGCILLHGASTSVVEHEFFKHSRFNFTVAISKSSRLSKSLFR